MGRALALTLVSLVVVAAHPHARPAAAEPAATDAKAARTPAKKKRAPAKPKPKAKSKSKAPTVAPIDPALGRQVADEVNRLRRDPKAYAAHLRALRPRYDGKLLRLPGRDPIRTREGIAALDEAIGVLQRTPRRASLGWEDGLARAAADHAADIGARGNLDHYSADGSSPFDRVARHGILQGVGGENIDVGFRDPRLVVIHLLIDDGVANRGHRDAMLDPAYRQIGVTCGPHARYGVVCVMELAAGFVERAPPAARADRR
ncbi:MAG TPA: CAP domain-containing protein [Kofleriaceae bacterium]|nr:CAP domain-containing protein [Kofleriaceae bacterium]